MSILATLRAKMQTREVATVTVATNATHGEAKALTVTRVATVTVAKPKETSWLATDQLAIEYLERDTWPYTPEMNAREVSAFKVRQALFTDKGVNHDKTERLADRLIRRDREGDDRRLCLECTHLQGAGRWRCGNWIQADVARDGLARDLVLMLQRCPGYLKIKCK